MTSRVGSCEEALDVRDAPRIVEKLKVRRLLVVKERDNQIGGLSTGDLAAQVDDNQPISDLLASIYAHHVSHAQPIGAGEKGGQHWN
jgi:hypothetical protein